MGRPRGSKNQKPKATTPEDPSGLRAAGKKLADADAKKQLKLVVNDRDDVPVTREEVELPYALSETEIAHVNGQVMRLEVEITALSKEHSDLQTQARGKSKEIEKKRKEVSKLAAESHTKTRRILTGVRIEHDYQAAQLRFFRLDRGPRDVGELYDTTAMPPEERERAIFTAPKDAERVVVEDDETQPPDATAPTDPAPPADEPAVNAKGGDS